MANPTWPSSLPAYMNLDGFQETPTDQLVETQMETGPVKSRRRCTGDFPVLKGSIDVTAAQRIAFFDFHRTTLAGGSVPFDWVHPITRAATTFKFRKPTPALSAVKANRFRITFSIEVRS